MTHWRYLGSTGVEPSGDYSGGYYRLANGGLAGALETFSALYNPTASLTGMGGRDRVDASETFEHSVQDALDSLPSDLRSRMSNVAIVVADEPPPGQPLLGLYEGVPLTQRGSSYGGVLPDRITIYRGPLERLYGRDRRRLEQEIRRVVLHEVAHHFGISDERLIEIDRY